MSVPTLRWLQIHRYEQFAPVRVEFSERENLVLGINGAGKTRLLKLLRAVLGLDFGELRERPFDVEFELATVSAQDAERQVIITGRVQSGAGERVEGGDELPGTMQRRGSTLTASVSFAANDTKFDCAFKDGEVAIRNAAGAVDVISYSDDGSLLPPYLLGSPLKVVREFNELYPVCGSVVVSEADQEFQILTHVAEYSLSRGRRVMVDPGQRMERRLAQEIGPLLSYVASRMDREHTGEGIAPPPARSAGAPVVEAGEAGTVLGSIQAAIRATQLRLFPKVVRQSNELIECRGLGIRVRFVDGTELADTELTFGQRRFLYAGLMLLQDPDAPFLIDEVDNGLHPRLLLTLLTLLQGRQCFLAGHNKLIVDYTDFASVEDVQRKIHVVTRGDDGRQSVQVFDQATASDVFEKISVAIQSPSDVLLAEGLW